MLIALVLVEAVLRVLLRAARTSAASRAVLARIEAAEIACTLSSPSMIGVGSASSSPGSGCRRSGRCVGMV